MGLMEAGVYYNVMEHKPKTDNSLISTPNIVLHKLLTFSASVALMCQMAPTAWWVQQLHRFAIACVSVMFAVNVGVVFCLKRNRRRRAFTPLSIVAAYLSPVYILAIDAVTMLTTKRHLAMVVCVPLPLAATTYWLTGGETCSWFEDLVLFDVWLFVLVFLLRKAAWFVLNLHEKEELVRYFKTTAYDFMEQAPRAELLYAATNGFTCIVGVQLGKLFWIWVARSLGVLPIFQAFYLSGFHAFSIMGDPTWGWSCNMWFYQVYFRRWHRFFHLSPAQYLTKHFDHHDVLPLASIGSSGSGYLEAFHKSLSLWQNPYSALHGPFLIHYLLSAGDEWSHNMCPTAQYSSIVGLKHVHVDHHYGRTVPLGFDYEQEVEEDNFKYDQSLWENIATFLPEGFTLPEVEARGALEANFGRGVMSPSEWNLPGTLPVSSMMGSLAKSVLNETVKIPAVLIGVVCWPTNTVAHAILGVVALLTATRGGAKKLDLVSSRSPCPTARGLRARCRASLR